MLTSKEVGQMWDQNAELWATLAAEGYDLYRDLVNLPAFFSILPNIDGLKGLDIGCGDGHNTRLLAAQHAKMIGIDISKKFLKFAQENESAQPNEIKYIEGDATSLCFENETFDFVASFSTFMNIPNYEKAIEETYRVLKPGGFFQFSITHPCFWTHSMEWLFDENNRKRALACKDYFTSRQGVVTEWVFDGVDLTLFKDKKKFVTPIFRRPLSDWFNILIASKFKIEKVLEPYPSQEVINRFPEIDGSGIVPFFLIIRCRK